jgi:hypothetical protein
MKDAKLWRRILSEGVKCNSPDIVPMGTRSEMVGQIAVAPIIVDSRPRDELAEEGMAWRWDVYRKCSIPFGEFWIEGHTSGNKLWGALVTTVTFPKGKTYEIPEGGWLVGCSTFIAAESSPVVFTGVVRT